MLDITHVWFQLSGRLHLIEDQQGMSFSDEEAETKREAHYLADAS